MANDSEERAARAIERHDDGVARLEDTLVADAMLALQLLAQERGLAVDLRSELLPR